MMESKFKRLKLACYTASISMSIVANLPPILFLTFRSLYGLSYSLLGLLVLINFLSQLIVDLIFSFFSHRFNIGKTIQIAPLLTCAGLLIYALWPMLFPENAYIGLLMGTFIFSISGGLVEVLNSPVLATIPANDHDREMSKLHSIYAWGVVFIIIISTLFILFFGAKNWPWLLFILMLIPLCSALLFAGTDIPEMKTPEKISGALNWLKNKALWLCILCIFFGGAAECTMAQWASGYLEKTFSIPKVWGDVFGVALFSFMLGLGRTLYAKKGKNMGRILLISSLGATLCYWIAAITSHPILGLAACVLTGLCTSMLWPGSLIIASDRFPAGGVFIYAVMAAGGDLGASLGPQLVGVMTDIALSHPALIILAETYNLLPEQLGMKLGMLTGMLFPLAAIPLYYHIWRTQKAKNLTLKNVDN